MAVTAVIGIVLGAHGWSGRRHGLPSTLFAGSRPSASAPASHDPSAASPAPTVGPKLARQSYASYSFQVWPGPLSSTAQAAQTGLVITVHRQGSGITVSAGVAGQAAQPATSYPTGARVYIIEASMGDDSGGSDYNLGDDGLVVTDPQGRILQ